MGKRVADMTPGELEKKRARDRKENMTPEQLEKDRARRRERVLTLEQLEKKRVRERRGCKTPEQLEKKRVRERERVLTPEQIKRKRVRTTEGRARNATDLEVFMLSKIDQATRRPGRMYCVPSICPPKLAAKLAPVLEMLKTADASQRAAIRGVILTMRTTRELELIEDCGTMTR